MQDYAGWAQAGVAGVVAAVGTVFWAGQANTQIKDQQTQITAIQQKADMDHDKVIALAAAVDQIKSDTDETKGDVKQILQNQSDVKDALNHFNHKLSEKR